MGEGELPETKRHADAGVHIGCPYSAVGMHKALHAAIGLPRRSTSAPRMLAFVIPPEVRRSFMSRVWVICKANVKMAGGQG
jgi:hypothetical protein